MSKSVKGTIEQTVIMKVVKWYNQKTREILYGVDIKINGKWSHFKEGDEEPFYKTAHEASQVIKRAYFSGFENF